MLFGMIRIKTFIDTLGLYIINMIREKVIFMVLKMVLLILICLCGLVNIMT